MAGLEFDDIQKCFAKSKGIKEWNEVDPLGKMTRTHGREDADTP